MSAPSPIVPYAPGTSPAASFLPQVVTRIVDGVLDDPLDANGEAINDIGSISFGFADTAEIWIGGQHSDGREGSGWQLDHLDGSTQEKFDGILDAYSGLGTLNLTFRIKPGTFETYGDGVWLALEGWRIKGSGMRATTLKMTQPLVNDLNSRVIYSQYDNVEIHDLTLDCNYTALKAAAGAVTHVSIGGCAARSGIFNNVRVIKAGSNFFENFIIFMSADGPVGVNSAARFASAPKRVVITGCVIEDVDPNSSNLTGIVANTGYFESANIPMEDVLPYGGSLVMSFNRVDGGTYGTSEGTSKIGIAYQCGGFNSAKVFGNYARGAHLGFFQDTCPSRNLDIIFNTFEGCGIGIQFNGGGSNICKGGTIGWNNLILFDSAIALGSANHMTVDGNNVWPVPGCTLNPDAAFGLYNLGNGIGSPDRSANMYRNNRFDPAYVNFAIDVADGATGSPLAWNNRYFDGSTITKCKDNFFPYNGTNATIAGTVTAGTGFTATTGNVVLSEGRLLVTAPDNVEATAIAQFLSDNGQIGVGVFYSGIQMIGSNATNAAYIRPKGAASVYLGAGDKEQIDSSGNILNNGNQVVGARGVAIADATDAGSAITQLNLALARLRAHGLIAT